MYLKEFELRNFRKFYYKDGYHNSICFSNPHKEDDINIASRTSLIIGPNNCGKTTIISCLEKLLSSTPYFTEYDFNLDYINELFSTYPSSEDEFDDLKLPEICLVLKIELDRNNDLINNISPFLKISNLENKTVEIIAKWEVKEKEVFISKCKDINIKYKNYCSSSTSIDPRILNKRLNVERFHLLSPDNFQLNFYNSSGEQVNNFKLNNLIEIVSIKSNKIDSDKSLSNALKKIIKFRYINDTENNNRYSEINDTLFNLENEISSKLDKEYMENINNTLQKIIFSNQVTMKLDLSLDSLINNLIKCEYLENEHSIPENQYGLGYTNLIIIISEIISYVDNYHNEQRNSIIHLITIEEPETYMHPQMQELFIKKINDAIDELLQHTNKNINSQLLITTHSPHILNSKIHNGHSLSNINYIKCKKNHSEIVNLNDENITNTLSTNNTDLDERIKELEFIKKHIKFKISELFFAEAAIFVEGITEYHLLQYYIDEDTILSTKTISIIIIDGAHSKVYTNLIKLLGIPVVIITDLDIKRLKNEKGINENDDEDKTKTYKQIDNIEGITTTNETLKYFYRNECLSKICQEYYKQDNLMVCSQIEKINGFYATSFEEALILTNYDNKIMNNTVSQVKPLIYAKCKDNNCINKQKSFELQVKLAEDKSLFANTLLFNILTSVTASQPKPMLPQYIEDAFSFIKKEIKNND